MAVNPTPVDEKFALTTSRHFPQWLAATGGGIAFTTYQAGKLFLLGIKPGGSLSVFERTFPRCMGVGVSDDGRSLALATQYQLYASTTSCRRGREPSRVTTRSTRRTLPG